MSGRLSCGAHRDDIQFVSEVRHASEYGLDSSRTPFKLPKILVSIADWNDQKHYGKVDVTGLDSYDALTKLKDTVWHLLSVVLVDHDNSRS